MYLSNFIQQLLTQGSVSIHHSSILPDENEDASAINLLQQYYNEDLLEMPGTAPAFSETAALWAAKYFYSAVQLTILRNEEEAVIVNKLAPYNELITPSVIYSVDLIFRYLPVLLHLAQGLAPADCLVKTLTNTMEDWPFSSAEIELGEVKNEEIIFKHPSLKIAYLDRLIFSKNTKRIINSRLQEEVLCFTGTHLDIIWPQAATILKPLING